MSKIEHEFDEPEELANARLLLNGALERYRDLVQSFYGFDEGDSYSERAAKREAKRKEGFGVKRQADDVDKAHKALLDAAEELGDLQWYYHVEEGDDED